METVTDEQRMHMEIERIEETQDDEQVTSPKSSDFQVSFSFSLH